jgi:hypothetical protein
LSGDTELFEQLSDARVEDVLLRPTPLRSLGYLSLARRRRATETGSDQRRRVAPTRRNHEALSSLMPRRSRASPASAKTLRARARGRCGLRRGGVGLIALGERERHLQAEAACALLARDSDGGLERFLGGRSASGVAFQRISPRRRWKNASPSRWSS